MAHCRLTRPADFQDSLYIIKTPTNDIIELKTQQLKQYCIDNNLDFNQMKHIARNGPVKRDTSVHYKYDVKCLYNKVTKKTVDRDEIIKGWQK